MSSILRALAVLVVFACAVQAQQTPLPSNILIRDNDYLAPSSLDEMWQRSKVVALVTILSSEQKAFPMTGSRPYPSPYLRHSAKVQRVWKGENLAPKNGNIWIAYPGGTVVHRGTTIVTETDLVLNEGEQVLVFLTHYPATESFGLTFGPAAALVFDKKGERARVTKLLGAFAFPNKQSLSSTEILGAVDRLAKGKG